MNRIFLASAIGAVLGSAGMAIAAYPIGNTNYPIGITPGITARLVCVDNMGNPRNGSVPTVAGTQATREDAGVISTWLLVRCP